MVDEAAVVAPTQLPAIRAARSSKREAFDAMNTRIVKRTRGTTRSVVGSVVLCLHLGVTQSASAQQMWLPAPDREQRFGPNRIALDIGVLAASLGYARQMSPTAEWGFAVSVGAQTGFMLASGELTGDETMRLFVELLSGAVFLRGDVGARTELEGGVRVGWLYHATEYETTFRGLYTALQYRLGAVRVGPRVYWGRISEESGRSQVGFAVVPVTLGFRWSW